jgi:hypothetical protein
MYVCMYICMYLSIYRCGKYGFCIMIKKMYSSRAFFVFYFLIWHFCIIQVLSCVLSWGVSAGDIISTNAHMGGLQKYF